MPGNESPFSSQKGEPLPAAKPRKGTKSVAPSPDKRSADKRERILKGAIKVFARKGFYAARVSEIAKAAGVADGTIYL